MSHQLVCTSCSSSTDEITFADTAEQRQHYKSDWHRYNLKRRLVQSQTDGTSLQPVSLQVFESRLRSHKDELQMLNQVSTTKTFCETCHKKFGSENAWSNHLLSKRHKEAVARDVCSDKSETQSEMPVVASDADEDDDDWIDVDDCDDAGHRDIATTECLFCGQMSKSSMANLMHMSIDHSFFVPDIDYVVDIDGLLQYLGEKVGQGMMCLMCNSRSKHFRSIDAARRHMRDTSHCGLATDEMIEYADFYDYSASYPDASSMADGDEDVEVSPELMDDSGFELTLPSGKRIGHRSLMVYYKQYLNPKLQCSPTASHSMSISGYTADLTLAAPKLIKSRALSKALASHYGTVCKGLHRPLTATEVRQRAKDIAYMSRMRQKYFSRLGTKGNKLQRHFVDANLVF